MQGFVYLKYFSAVVLVSLIFKTPLIKSHEIKLGLQNYSVVMPIEKNYIRFSNSKIKFTKA